MNAKSLILLSAGAVLVAGGATIYTGNAYDSAIQEQVNLYNTQLKELGFDAVYTNNASSFFSREDQLTITITEDYFMKIGMPADDIEPMSITMNNHCTIFPFYVSCNNDFTLGDDSLSETIKPFIESVDYQISWSLNALTQTIYSEFTTQQYVFSDEEHQFTIDPIYMEGKSGTDFKNTVYNLDWEGMTAVIQEPMGKVSVELGAMHFEGNMERVKDALYTGDMTGNMSHFAITGDNSMAMKAENMTMSTSTKKLDSALYSMGYTFNADAVTVESVEPVVVKDIKVDVGLSGLSEAFLEVMSGFNQTFDPEDPESIKTLLNTMGENPLKLNVDNVAFNYKDVDVTSTGSADLAAFSFADIEAQTLPEKVNAEYSITIGKNALEAMPEIAPMLDQYLQMGVITQTEDGTYTTKITFENRMVSANGVPITQL